MVSIIFGILLVIAIVWMFVRLLICALGIIKFSLKVLKWTWPFFVAFLLALLTDLWVGCGVILFAFPYYFVLFKRNREDE
jgi:hypothetical protein